MKRTLKKVEMINMEAKKPFQFSDDGENFIPCVREMPSLQDQENFQVMVDQRYQMAQTDFCRSLIASYKEEFLLQNKISLN